MRWKMFEMGQMTWRDLEIKNVNPSPIIGLQHIEDQTVWESSFGVGCLSCFSWPPQEGRLAFQQVNFQELIDDSFHELHSILVLLKRNIIHFRLSPQLKNCPLLSLLGLSFQHG